MGRKSVKFSEAVFDELKAEQREGESWDGLARRLLDTNNDGDVSTDDLLEAVEAAERAAEQARDATERTHETVERLAEAR
jgi:hypothetical protein